MREVHAFIADVIRRGQADGVLNPDRDPEAEAWIQKGGPGHYAEHIPRLRDWVEEVQGGSNASGSDSIG